MYFDRRGRLCDAEFYHDRRRQDHYRRVGLTQVGRFTVSTVWLGIDHNPNNFAWQDGQEWYEFDWERSPPHIFETTIWPTCIVARRYSSLVYAVWGHDEVVLELESAMRGHFPNGDVPTTNEITDDGADEQ